MSQLEPNQIICGDVRDFIDQIPDGIFISDPPYNQGYHYDNYPDRLPKDEYIALLQKVFGGERAIVIHYPEQALNLFHHIGEVEQVVCWVYPSNTAKQSRLIAWFGCQPDFTKIPQPYKNPTDKRIQERIANGKSARSYDWWEINQVKNVSKSNNPHSCPIPEELARRIILSTTKIGELVIDPFCGSGTILKVAKELGRNYLGFDVSPLYVKTAQESINHLGGRE